MSVKYGVLSVDQLCSVEESMRILMRELSI
jgi:hypothetical protein